jgi:hypothetical protein
MDAPSPPSSSHTLPASSATPAPENSRKRKAPEPEIPGGGENAAQSLSLEDLAALLHAEGWGLIKDMVPKPAFPMKRIYSANMAVHG